MDVILVLRKCFRSLSNKSVDSTSSTEQNLLNSRFVFFVILFILGVIVGSFFTIIFDLFSDSFINSLFFSGIPNPELGFLSSFSTFLLNALITIIVLFLMGVTAFGIFAVPIFVFFKGITVGIGVLSFLYIESVFGLLKCGLIYTPAISAITFFILLFACRAQVFSDKLVKISFMGASVKNLKFSNYLKDFLQFLIFIVSSSFIGAVFSTIYVLFFF